MYVWNFLELVDACLDKAEIGVLVGHGVLHVDIKII